MRCSLAREMADRAVSGGVLYMAKAIAYRPSLIIIGGVMVAYRQAPRKAEGRWMGDIIYVARNGWFERLSGQPT
jgi:hypothetical protein